MSPLAISILSSKVMVTDIGANASAIGPSNVSIDLIFDENPDGRTSTSSPGLKIPPAIRPA